jgi:hypothetical protein
MFSERTRQLVDLSAAVLMAAAAVSVVWIVYSTADLPRSKGQVQASVRVARSFLSNSMRF